MIFKETHTVILVYHAILLASSVYSFAFLLRQQ